MCPPKRPKAVEVDSAVEHPNSRLANPTAYALTNKGGVGLADNSQKTAFSSFTFSRQNKEKKTSAGGSSL